jgi:hypothetical protein
MQSGHSGLAHLEGRICIKESKTIDDATLKLAKLVKRRRMEEQKARQEFKLSVFKQPKLALPKMGSWYGEQRKPVETYSFIDDFSLEELRQVI